MDPAVPFILMMIDDNDYLGFRAPQLLDINAYDSNLDLYFSFFLLAASHGRPESKVTGHTLNARMLGTPLGAGNVFWGKVASLNFVRRHRLPLREPLPHHSVLRRTICTSLVWHPQSQQLREGPSNSLCLQSVTEAAGAVVGDSGTNVSAVGCHRREMPTVISKQS